MIDEKVNGEVYRNLPRLPLDAIRTLPKNAPILISSTSHMETLQSKLLARNVDPARLILLYPRADLTRMAALAAEIRLPDPPPRSEFEIKHDRVMERLGHILDQMGFAESLRIQRSVRADGRPLPWLTYPAIQFLDQLDLSSASMFEWGCGHSTLYFASICRSVRSIECDVQWLEEMRRAAPANVELHLRTVANFAESIDEFPDFYDIILIDAERRRDCAAHAASRIRDTGLIILDNSDHCLLSCEDLRSKGLIQIDFYGFSPAGMVQGVTSFFLAPRCRLIPKSTQPVRPAGGLDRNLDNAGVDAPLPR